MSRISFTQQGIVAQYELAKILIITSKGMLEVALPLTDDDRRDMEIHIRGKFARSLALQVKAGGPCREKKPTNVRGSPLTKTDAGWLLIGLRQPRGNEDSTGRTQPVRRH